MIGSLTNSSIEMGDDSGDKRGRGRPRKQDVGVVDASDSLDDKKAGGRGRPRKAAEAASAAVKDQSNRDDDGEPKAKRGRGRPKGSTGKRRKRGRVSAKKRGKSAKGIHISFKSYLYLKILCTCFCSFSKFCHHLSVSHSF
jgi:hypothetical protein